MRQRVRPVSLISCAYVIALMGLASALLPAVADATPPAGITGTVTNANSATNAPIANLNVCASGSGGTFCAETQADGKYTLEEPVKLTEGGYTVTFTGQVCVGGTCTPEYVEKVVSSVQVTAGKLTEVNGPLLEIDGKISGRVTSGGTPVGNVEVCAFGAGYNCATTNSGGEYTIERLGPGSYLVLFTTGEVCKAICQPAGNYTTEYWNNQQSLEAASTVTVKSSETTTAINAELQLGGHISGKVTNASIYEQPIADIVVCATPTKTDKAGAREGESNCALTNSSGEYDISALATGGYEVEFRGEACVEVKGAPHCTHPYISQFYQAIVSVSAPGTTSQINGNIRESAPVKPTNTAAPAVTAAATLQATGYPTLSCSTGSWAGNPTSLTYRWLHSGVAIAGQTANTYAAQSTDAGKGITCEVTASNGAGATAAISNTVQIPKPAPGVAVVQSTSVKNGSTVSLTLLCTGSNSCSGALKIVASASTGHGKHKKTHSTTIGTASFSMASGKRLTLTVRLSSQGRKLLGQAGKKGLDTRITGSGVKSHTAVLKSASKHRH
jgi:hypothetical protein